MTDADDGGGARAGPSERPMGQRKSWRMGMPIHGPPRGAPGAWKVMTMFSCIREQTTLASLLGWGQRWFVRLSRPRLRLCYDSPCVGVWTAELFDRTVFVVPGRFGLVSGPFPPSEHERRPDPFPPVLRQAPPCHVVVPAFRLGRLVLFGRSTRSRDTT